MSEMSEYELDTDDLREWARIVQSCPITKVGEPRTASDALSLAADEIEAAWKEIDELRFELSAYKRSYERARARLDKIDGVTRN